MALEHSLAILLLLAVACGGNSDAVTKTTTPLLPPPERSAVENDNLRRLMVAVAERQLCDQVKGQFVALPDGTETAEGSAAGASPSAGRLWIEDCRAEQRGDNLMMRLEGPGWIWVEQEAAGPMGSTFKVQGFLRFHGIMELEGSVDLAYTDKARLISLWMTPQADVKASITPTGSVPVEPEGGWSSFLAAVGGAIGDSIEERAKPMVEEQGGQMMAEVLQGGFTFTVDVCTGQADSTVGPLANGEKPVRPYPHDGILWQANQRVRLRAGGIDVAGPFASDTAPIHFDFEGESGEGADVELYCEADAANVVRAHLADEPINTSWRPITTHRIDPGSSSYLEADSGRCPVVAILKPRGKDPTVLKYRVYEVGAEATPMINACEEAPATGSPEPS